VNIKPCPFCGVYLQAGRGSGAQHPINRCALSNCWFTAAEWNRRTEPDLIRELAIRYIETCQSGVMGPALAWNALSAEVERVLYEQRQRTESVAGGSAVGAGQTATTERPAPPSPRRTQGQINAELAITFRGALLAEKRSDDCDFVARQVRRFVKLALEEPKERL
jgi:hypothetical protein